MSLLITGYTLNAVEHNWQPNSAAQQGCKLGVGLELLCDTSMAAPGAQCHEG